MSKDYRSQDEKVIEAFQIMWSKYPEPAMLINRGKRVMAVNWASRFVEPNIGAYCHEIGGCQEMGNTCLMNKCIDDHQAAHIKINQGSKQWTIHWVPIEGFPDYCVHFFAGSGEAH